MGPRLFVAASCWATMVKEFERVAPAEAVMVPVVSVERRAHAAEPWQSAHLMDLAAVRIVDVITVPHQIQRNSALHVSVLPGTDPWLDRRLKPLLSAQPGLRPAAYVHSHPFSVGSTFASATDHRGHLVPLCHNNVRSGLMASFSFIACRGRGGVGWRLQCFAVDARALHHVEDLGFCVVEADDSHALQQARLPSLLRRQNAVLHRWRDGARRQGWKVMFGCLMDGWVRARVQVSRDWSAAVFFPPDFSPDTSHVPTYAVRHRSQTTRRLVCSFDVGAVQFRDAMHAVMTEEPHARLAAEG